MNPIIGLSVGRMLVGVLFFLRPDLAGRLMGQDVKQNPELALGARLFGSRDFALGAATLLAKGTARRNLIVAGIAVDAADAAAAGIGTTDRSIKPLPAALLGGVALMAVGQGILALRKK